MVSTTASAIAEVRDASSHLPSKEENSEPDDMTTALDYLNELTELREFLEMCLDSELAPSPGD